MRAPDAQLLEKFFDLAFKAAQLVAQGKDELPQLWWKVPNTSSVQVEGPYFEIPSHAKSHQGLFWVVGINHEVGYDDLEYWVQDPRNAEDVVRFCNDFGHEDRLNTKVHEVDFVPEEELRYCSDPDC